MPACFEISIKLVYASVILQSQFSNLCICGFKFQSIFFKDVKGMLKCLEAISSDSTVQVVRLNNRLDERYDGAATAGYRDVSLNLRLSAQDTQLLGLNGYVCELQLILIDFARIKV
jgi:hypothetical protein